LLKLFVLLSNTFNLI